MCESGRKRERGEESRLVSLRFARFLVVDLAAFFSFIYVSFFLSFDHRGKGFLEHLSWELERNSETKRSDASRLIGEAISSLSLLF